MIVSTSTPALQLPTTPLQAPKELIDQITVAISEGSADAITFRRSHRREERWLVPGWALLRMKWPPKGEQQQAELDLLHSIAKARTPEQTATANWYSDHGLTEAWDIYLADYARQVGPAQARAAKKLLDDTLNMVNEITQTAKAASGRKRPYDVDSTLPVAVDKPGGSPSYPSGHTSAAFAAAIVLGYLMPQRANEFLNIAMQAAYARSYSGVHFPSDLASGAKLAATVAFYSTRSSKVLPLGVMQAAAGAHQSKACRKRAA